MPRSDLDLWRVDLASTASVTLSKPVQNSNEIEQYPAEFLPGCMEADVV